MSVKQRLFIYKILNNMLAASLRNKIEIAGSERQRQTRQAGNIVLGLRKTRNAQKSVFYEGIKMYNPLPLWIKQCDRLKIFKRELREYISNICYDTIFLVILIQFSIISLFCCVLHFLHFVFLFSYFIVLLFVLCILYFVFENV